MLPEFSNYIHGIVKHRHLLKKAVTRHRAVGHNRLTIVVMANKSVCTQSGAHLLAGLYA